jgi:hypothetical protein
MISIGFPLYYPMAVAALWFRSARFTHFLETLAVRSAPGSRLGPLSNLGSPALIFAPHWLRLRASGQRRTFAIFPRDGSEGE